MILLVPSLPNSKYFKIRMIALFVFNRNNTVCFNKIFIILFQVSLIIIIVIISIFNKILIFNKNNAKIQKIHKKFNSLN